MPRWRPLVFTSLVFVVVGVLVVEHPGDCEPEVGAEEVDEDGVAGVHCVEVVPAYDLIDDEDDRLHHRHHNQLDGRGHSCPTQFS